MSVFTLEVAGRPVACIRAATRAEAEQRVEDPWFRDGLFGIEGSGTAASVPAGELRLREASPEELELVSDRMVDEDRDRAAIFLVPRQDHSQGTHRLILASRVEDAPVFSETGESIGHIQDLSIDRYDGHVAYAIMSFGGFLGIGRRFHPVPWSMLRYDPGRGGYVVALDRAALAGAPYYDAHELRDLGGPSGEADRSQIVEYYGRYGAPMF